ncbi:endoribonuclease YbeY-like [Aplysia californica]|uniref:Endoribonuclease YbeY-like n=1 Tax=Aplysia californica TaxID=6500 RepID=A0ABM0JPH5_APLCA|nr:endoribonuclease YbeY-like [Aplysia californica]
MTLVIRNLQQAVKVNIFQLHFDSCLIRKLAGYERFGFGVMLTSDEEIRLLNEQYRGENDVTDVLAFPYHEISPDNAGCVPETCEDEMILGDIVLGLPYIACQAQKNKEHFDSSVMTMITHGLCHLVGFDHETHEQWTKMWQREMDILTKFNKVTGYRCSPLLAVGHFSEEY